MLTVLIDSFDGYSDLWPAFFAVFERHWPTCPYPVRLVSNHKTFDGVETITVGDETTWSARTLAAVTSLDTEYVLLLLEDYLLGRTVDTADVDELLSYAREHDARYLRLSDIPKSRYHRGEKYYPLYTDEEYGVNLQASLWRRDYLIECLERYSGSAWDFEIGLLRETVDTPHERMVGCYGMSTDPLAIHNGVLKGKWFPQEIRYFSRLGIAIDWQARGRLSTPQLLKYRLSVGLKNILSYRARKRLKALLRKCGVKFASDL